MAVRTLFGAMPSDGDSFVVPEFHVGIVAKRIRLDAEETLAIVRPPAGIVGVAKLESFA
jgi:hypothetical protein